MRGRDSVRILAVCQHYWPEPFNISDVCEELARRGHEVVVLAGLPNTGMPGNEIPKEYRKDKTLRVQERNGVNIIRAWLWPRREGALNRILNYLSFWLSANWLSSKLDGGFDVVLGYQFSPVMQVDPGIRYAERTGTPMILYSFDLWPESLVAGGIGRESLPFRWIKSVSKRIYSSADTLAVTSPGFYDYFSSELGLEFDRKVYLPQYAEDLFGVKTSGDVDSSLFPPNEVHFMFAGNIGKAQSVTTIIETAAIMRKEPARFHIVGSGSALGECEARARELSLENVTFHGRHELEEMPAYYAMADAMLATLAGGPMIGYTLPRKVQSYLAASKPVIGTLEGEGRRVVEEACCGFSCDAEDSRGLAKACRKFMALSASEKKELGDNARSYYEDHFSKERFFDLLESELTRLKGTRHAS